MSSREGSFAGLGGQGGRIRSSQPGRAQLGYSQDKPETRSRKRFPWSAGVPVNRAGGLPRGWSRASGGAGNNGPVSTAKSVQFPERGWHDGRVTISERIETARRERRGLAPVLPPRG